MHTSPTVKYGRRGSILMECLIALNVLLFLIPTVVSSAALLRPDDPVLRNIQDRIQMIQCRRMISSGTVLQVEDHQLEFMAEGKQRRLHEKNGWLLIEPGTWILCDQVRKVRFEQKEDVILIHVTTETGSFTDVIAYEK